MDSSVAHLTLTPEARRIKRMSILFLILMVLGSIGLDQVTKVNAQAELMRWTDGTNPSLYQGQRYKLFTLGADSPAEGAHLSLSFNYVRNLGAAWGALSTIQDSFRVPFFYGVTVVAIIIIGFYLRSTPIHHRLAIFALTLILSGAIGNFVDRVRLGYVIDWIDVRWNLLGWRYDFPNFNIADSAITVGVTLLLVDIFILDLRRKKRMTAQAV